MSYTAVDVVKFGCYAALLVVNARFKECALHKFLMLPLMFFKWALCAPEFHDACKRNVYSESRPL